MDSSVDFSNIQDSIQGMLANLPDMEGSGMNEQAILDMAYKQVKAALPGKPIPRSIIDGMVKARLPKKTFKCAQCAKEAPERCAGCQKVYYCSKDCQKAHWK